MSIPEWPNAPGPRILTLAGNDLTIDSRARKTARSLAAAGFSVIMMGLDASGDLPRESDFAGALMVRVTPPRNPRLTPRALRLSPSALVESLAQEVELQRERLQMSRRDLTATRALGGPGAQPWAQLIRRYRPILMQRRYQVTALTHRLSRQAQRRRSARRRSWRRDLPEMHKWEAAIGPLADALKPDLIHCHDIFHLGLAVRAKARASVAGSQMKVVYDAQEFIPGLPSDPWRRAAYASLEAEYIGGADATVTVSDSLGDLLFDRYGVRPTIVMNAPEAGIDAVVTPLREVVGLGDDATLACYVGGLAPDRGAEILLAGLALMPSQVHLVFVTNAVGGYRDALASQASAAGLADRVHFAPFVEPEAVSSYISSADLTIIPLSRDVLNYEVALPNKLFQSVHAAVPVVVSDNPEMARFVEHYGLGAVFNGGDPSSLAHAVSDVIDQRSQLIERLREPELLMTLSWERQAAILTETYRSVGVLTS